jgi:hypothetical protein
MKVIIYAIPKEGKGVPMEIGKISKGEEFKFFCSTFAPDVEINVSVEND